MQARSRMERKPDQCKIKTKFNEIEHICVIPMQHIHVKCGNQHIHSSHSLLVGVIIVLVCYWLIAYLIV